MIRLLAAMPLLVTGRAVGLAADIAYNTGARIAGSSLRQGVDIDPATGYVYTTTI